MTLNESLKTVSTTSKIVAIIFFGALAVISFFVGAWFQRNIDITNQVSAKLGNPISGAEITPTPTMLPTAKPGTDPYLGWNTYVTTEEKYTFKYPTNLFIGKYNFTGNPDANIIIGTEAQAKAVNTAVGGSDGGFKQKLISIDYRSVNTEYSAPTSIDNDQVTSKDITVGGIKTKEYTIKHVKDSYGQNLLSVGEQYKSIVVFDKNSHEYSFTIYEKNNDYSVADKIINSFKFN